MARSTAAADSAVVPGTCTSVSVAACEFEVGDVVTWDAVSVAAPADSAASEDSIVPMSAAVRRAAAALRRPPGFLLKLAVVIPLLSVCR